VGSLSKKNAPYNCKESFAQSTVLGILLLMYFFYAATCTDEDSVRSEDSTEQ